MPFTFSHPALIVPLLYARQRYKWLSATGLIMGSMAPDAEKFFRLKLASQHSHTIGSIFYFSCPVSIGLAFIFHVFVRRPLIAHLPSPLYRRLGKYTNFNWLNYYRQHIWGIMLSIVIGAALHLFWDSFTHYNTLIAAAVPETADMVRLGDKAMPLWQFVALVSSIVGGLIIGYYVWKMPVSLVGHIPSASAVCRYWGIVALVAASLETVWVLAVHPRLLNAGISSISATMLGVLVASICVDWRNKGLQPGLIKT
jgi:phosphoglycerol transferase MdoB-like AlkP superfamily enzyme